MKKKAIIFIGASGAGKGTQAKILKEKILEKREKLLYINTGDCVRELFKKETLTSKNSLELVRAGKLFPEFLAIFLWSSKIIEEYNIKKFLILDGAPRTLPEAKILEESLKFYKIKNPTIIYLKSDLSILKERMLERKRMDDKNKVIEIRLNWFEKKVLPILKYYSNNDYYQYHEINGEKKIEEISKEIAEIIFERKVI